jgi:DNA-binding transcriptional LysR family regulator
MKTTLDELLTFATVVDAGSLTATADRLGQTASGVSRTMSRLEDKLGTTLLRRTTRRLELTEEGALFLVHARQVLDAVEAAEDQIAARRQRPAGKLRVNAASPFMLHVLVPRLADFRAQYPEIELELNTSDDLIDLIEQRTDLAIRIGSLRDSSLHARRLGSYALRVLASPAYLKAHGKPRTVDELRTHSLIGFTQPDSLNRWPLRHAEEAHYEITPSLRASSGETIRQLALAGHGIVCLADFMTEADRQRGDLVQVLARHTVDVQQPVHAVYYRNTELAARIRVFLEYLAAELRLAS